MATQTTNKGKPFLANLEPYIAAGIDPKTGLPVKLASALEGAKKGDIMKLLRIMDEQDAVNRYVWHNLPCNISSQELERMIYYKGQLAFFYMEPLDEFFFMPYALDGGLDFYGRFKTIHPVPFSNGSSDTEKKEIERQRNYLSTLKLDVVYDVPDELMPYNNVIKSCVLLHDYSKQLSQTVIPSQTLMDPLLDIMSDCIPFMHTTLMNSTGTMGMRVNGEDEQANVWAANDSIKAAALTGNKYVPIVGRVDFQDLTSGQVAQAEEFIMAMQSLDNFRKQLRGIPNGGLYQKKAHMLESEQQMNGSPAESPLEDGLHIRQRFCDIANSIFGTVMSCDIAESISGVDMNGDMLLDNSQDQSGMMKGEQPQGGVTNDGTV